MSHEGKGQFLGQQLFSGMTDSDGVYSVTYPFIYPSVPDVQPQIQSGTSYQSVRIQASTVTGFTVKVTDKAITNIMGVNVVSATDIPVSGASISVLVTTK